MKILGARHTQRGSLDPSTSPPPTSTAPDRFDARPASTPKAFLSREDFLALPAATQRALSALFDCKHNPRSQRAQDALHVAANAQSINWTGFLTDRAVVVDVLKREQALPVLPNKNQVTVSGQNAEVHWTTPAGQQASKSIPIDASSADLRGSFADYLRAVPPEVIALLDRIVIHDAPNEDDAYWTKKYGVPVRAAMSNSEEGALNVYPEAFTQNRQTMVKNILHEVGHTWSLRAMGNDDTSAQWAPWREAMQADVMTPSAYGSVSVAEDAAESFLLWFASRGSEQFDDYERMMPNRFAFMRAHLAPNQGDHFTTLAQPSLAEAAQ